MCAFNVIFSIQNGVNLPLLLLAQEAGASVVIVSGRLALQQRGSLKLSRYDHLQHRAHGLDLSGYHARRTFVHSKHRLLLLDNGAIKGLLLVLGSLKKKRRSIILGAWPRK